MAGAWGQHCRYQQKLSFRVPIALAMSPEQQHGAVELQERREAVQCLRFREVGQWFRNYTCPSRCSPFRRNSPRLFPTRLKERHRYTSVPLPSNRPIDVVTVWGEVPPANRLYMSDEKQLTEAGLLYHTCFSIKWTCFSNK